MHTHTPEHTLTKSLSFCQERKSGFVLGFRVSFTNSREKNAKKFCVCSFLFRVWAHPLPEKKRSPLFLFFPAFLVLEKKIFSEMRCTQRSAYYKSLALVFLTFYTTSSSTMAASSLTAAALGSKVAFANKVRLMNNASCLDSGCSFFSWCRFSTRARCTRKGTYEREIIFSVKFYHLSLEKLSSQTNARKRGYKTHSFPTKSARLATVNDDLFVRE